MHGAAIAHGNDRGFIEAVARIGMDAQVRASMAVASRAATSGLRPEQVAADFEHLLLSLVDHRRRDAVALA